MTFYYTTIETDKALPSGVKFAGRASHCFKSKESAEKIKASQNARAKAIGLKVRYEVASCDDDALPRNESARD